MFKKIKPHLNLNNAVLAVALLITGNWVWGTVDAIQRNFVLQQQVDGLAQQNEYYNLQNETLTFEQKYYNTSEYLELSAREHLNKAGPGEKVLILPPSTITSKNTDTLPVNTVTPVSKRSNFEQWMYFLFGNKRQ